MASQKSATLTKNDIWEILKQFNNKILAPQFGDIRGDIYKLDQRVSKLETKVSKIEQTMATKKDLQNLKDELRNEIISVRKFLISIKGSSKKEYKNLSRRVDHIETQLHLTL